MKQFTSIPLIFLLVLLVSSCYDGVNKSHDINSIPSLPGIQGKAGSMARFTIADSALYVLTDNTLHVYDITNSQEPILENSLSLSWGMETVFVYDTLLFLGSQSSMFVYDISNQHDITFLSNYWHATACDPVVFDGKYAYVTLNSEHIACGRFINELQIIDLSNITNPILKKTYQMTSPKGLGVDGDLLFVCDGNKMKIYSKQNPLSLSLKKEYDMHNAYDVIPYNGLLIATSKSGIYQYSYSTQTYEVEQLSHIPVEK